VELVGGERGGGGRRGGNRLQGRLASRAGGYGRCSKHVGRPLSSWARTHEPSQSDEVLATFAGLVPGSEGASRSSERERARVRMER
jgi:hypothetical protein